jgi:hypothetical protein
MHESIYHLLRYWRIPEQGDSRCRAEPYDYLIRFLTRREQIPEVFKNITSPLMSNAKFIKDEEAHSQGKPFTSHSIAIGRFQ